MCKICLPIIFLCEFFVFFLTDSKSESNFVFYDTLMNFLQKNVLLILALFADFKAKRVQNRKKTKNVFYKCVLESHSHPFPVWEAPSWQLKSSYPRLCTLHTYLISCVCVKGLRNNTFYDVRVRTQNKWGWSPFSLTFTFHTVDKGKKHVYACCSHKGNLYR